MESECRRLAAAAARQDEEDFAACLKRVRKRFSGLKPLDRHELANGLLFALTDLAVACGVSPASWASHVKATMARVQDCRIPTAQEERGRC